ncbi:unnamed protein product [Mytilus coruscus]|uniref:KY-like immunoglobulin-like domain-containing protein n=1 Tax=Mytilus coruscus TaxID=42192 RepID=A0A6J8EC15_MYTCO|nr:unnamed protein product [Mytilus coruscus]
MAKPELPRGYLGAQPKFGDVGLSTLSHDNPEITLDTNEVEIKFRTKYPVKVTANLVNTITQQESSDTIFTQTQGDVVSFIVKMSSVGYHKFQIFALKASDDSKTLPGVYNYLLNCTRLSHRVLQFPKQYAQWKQGCYLSEPLTIDPDGSLNDIKFRVLVPGAHAVAITVGDNWTQLENVGKDNWEGRASAVRGERLTLNANYKGADSTKYATLLEYAL